MFLGQYGSQRMRNREKRVGLYQKDNPFLSRSKKKRSPPRRRLPSSTTAPGPGSATRRASPANINKSIENTNLHMDLANLTPLSRLPRRS